MNTSDATTDPKSDDFAKRDGRTERWTDTSAYRDAMDASKNHFTYTIFGKHHSLTNKKFPAQRNVNLIFYVLILS